VPGLTSSFGNARPAKKPISCSLLHSSILGLQGRIAQSKLQFTGNAAPASESPLLLKAATSARSSTTTTTVSAAGVRNVIKPVAGESAQFESQVTMTAEATFEEHGCISFDTGSLNQRQIERVPKPRASTSAP